MFLLPCYFALFILYFMTDFNILYQMATKPLTTEAIALTEKKMDMALEDIIKMSKNPKSRGRKQRRVPVRFFFFFFLFLFCESKLTSLISSIIYALFSWAVIIIYESSVHSEQNSEVSL